MVGKPLRHTYKVSNMLPSVLKTKIQNKFHSTQNLTAPKTVWWARIKEGRIYKWLSNAFGNITHKQPLAQIWKEPVKFVTGISHLSPHNTDVFVAHPVSAD